MAPVRFWPAVLLGSLVLVAGCVDPPAKPDASTDPPIDDVIPPLLKVTEITIEDVMTFTESIVSPAQGVAADLYEPTMEVSDTGTLYVAAHVIGAATTGTPAYFSNDDGATWEQLPFLGPAQFPSPIQGAQPPPGDEGFIVAGADGEAWMADIYAAGFTVSGWCGNGAELCYDNRYAYDRTATATQSCEPLVSLNDRPWAAYANGTLLLVNNPGGGPMQIGVMQVPPLTPVGLFDPVTGPKWNLCASPDGWIPGIPAMRDDGFFAVPQMTGAGADSRLTVVTGNKADIMDVEVRDAFHVTSSGGGTSNGGRTAFGLDGTLFVGAYNNTAGGKGQFILAASADDGETFVDVTFKTGSSVRSLYLDSNLWGPGALLTWSQLGTDAGRSDWYVAHVFLGPHGEPVLGNVTLAVDEGPHSSAHVMGAAVGPDGRAYFVNFEEEALPGYVGSTPIRVIIQEDGPTLPHG